MTGKRTDLPGPAQTISLPVDTRGLVRVGARPPLLEYLVKIWDHRAFVFYDAKARVQTGNRKDRLGSAWMILNPIFNGLTFYLIFGLLLQTGRGIENFLGYLIVGVFLFQFSSRSIMGGSKSIRSNLALIQAFEFPRAALLLSVNIREMIAIVPVLLTMLVLVLALPPEETVSWLWFFLIPVVALQAVFNLGVGLLLARLVSQIADVANLLSFAMRLWMYGSAVFFSYERFIGNEVLLSIVQWNPMFQVLDIARDCILYETVPDLRSWLILSIWALGALVIGLIYFWRGEETYGKD
ncbi:ABC transporter permease [Arthrobacter sp. Bz4]|uniref:ABC transporter permease n=1 Tax=Arthrobacter sp. Bz4 TaxID=2171979 RepID=UPI000D522FF3|nr:ABC transporter permease [Arthrobacter sp. Bz4]PVE15874.1 phosphate ABC transporter permease [Arthrobacter sp. Bz4]